VIDYQLARADNDLFAQARAMVGVPIAGDLSIFAGGSVSAAFAFGDKDGVDPSFLSGKRYDRDSYVLAARV